MDRIKTIEAMYQPAELNDDLVAYYSVNNGIPMIKHPLVFSIFHTDNQNYIINQHYEWKKQAVRKARTEREWSSYVFLHERPFRLNAFLDIEPMVREEPDQYWELLGEIWVDSENIWQNKEAWRYFLESGPEEGREMFMSEEDRLTFHSLPEKFKVYRGYIPRRNKSGFSYTMDRDKAEWFANRFGNGVVLERIVSKEDVFAYKNDRNEQEIIILN